MPNLFVDCDDTLVLWNYNGDADTYKPNSDLIDDISCFLGFHKDYRLIVWSTGGTRYASKWAKMFFANIPWSTQEKDMGTPRGQDIVVDDWYEDIVAVVPKSVKVLPPSLCPCPVCRIDLLLKYP